jgi:serine/threonine protein kinase
MNIMHRDIKPGNIVFDDNGHIALADFGLAKIFEPNTKSDHGDVSLTVDDKINSTSSFKQHKCIANDVCGTPFYMSPEMHFGEDYSFDVDYWALGIVLYRMLTGRVRLDVFSLSS